MKKLFLLSVIILMGAFYVNGQNHYYINNQTSGSRSYSVSPNTETIYHINAGVNKYIKISFNVQSMGSAHEIYVKDDITNGKNYYSSGGSGFFNINFSKTIITTVANGKVLIGYKNTDEGPTPTVNFSFSVVDPVTQNGIINPEYLFVSQESNFMGESNFYKNTLFNQRVGIGITSPSYPLDVNGTIQGTSLRVRNSTTNHYINISASSTNSSFQTSSPFFCFLSPVRVRNGRIGTDGTYYNLQLQTNGTTRMTILNSNGNVGIGTINPQHALDVNGTIRAKEIIVETGWADFVFEKDYPLLPLDEVRAHIEENKHLPGIPTEAEVKENGIGLGEMQVKLLQKIEELTLYIIEQDKKIEKQNKELQELKNKLE